MGLGLTCGSPFVPGLGVPRFPGLCGSVPNGSVALTGSPGKRARRFPLRPAACLSCSAWVTFLPPARPSSNGRADHDADGHPRLGCPSDSTSGQWACIIMRRNLRDRFTAHAALRVSAQAHGGLPPGGSTALSGLPRCSGPEDDPPAAARWAMGPQGRGHHRNTPGCRPGRGPCRRCRGIIGSMPWLP